MNWIQRLLCPDSGKIAQLEKDLTAKDDKIKWLEDQKGMDATPDFIFDSSLVKSISNSQLQQILVGAYPSAELKLADAVYQIISLEDVKRFLLWDNDDKLYYVMESHDCDKYSLAMAYKFKSAENFKFGNSAFFDVWGTNKEGGGHAFNIVLTDMGIYFIEPQTNELWALSDQTSHGYTPTLFMG